MALKRSDKIFAGAAGIVLLAWGLERSYTPLPPLPPECLPGVDGKAPDLPQCKPSQRNSSSSSSSSSGWRSSSSSSSGFSSSSNGGSAVATSAVSRGGFGGTAVGFSSGG